jgi:hypothetical protein
VVEYADVDDEDELEQAIRSLPEHSYVFIDFEASPGLAEFEICEPLHPNAVSAIQEGVKPKFVDTNPRKEALTSNAQQTSRTAETGKK